MSKKEINKELREFHVAVKHSASQWVQRLEEEKNPCGDIDYILMLSLSAKKLRADYANNPHICNKCFELKPLIIIFGEVKKFNSKLI